MRVGDYVRCEYGLGKIRSITDGVAYVYIQSFGCRHIPISELTPA